MSLEQRRITGFVPGGEDRVQWIFEGNDWPDDLTQPIIAMITQCVQEYRQKYGFDFVSWLKFTYVDDIIEERIFYITRRHWRYHEQCFSTEALLAKVPDILAESLR